MTWHTVVIDRADAVQGSKLVLAANQGLPVSAHEAAFQAQYIHNYLMLNEGKIPVEIVQNIFGWCYDPQQPPSFLLSDRMIGAPGAEQVSYQPMDGGDIQIARGLQSQGSLPDWVENIYTPVQPYPVARLFIHASIASPLLHIVGAKNVGLDLSGRTSHGKTTMLRAGASSWGNPDRLMLSWDTTLVGFERQSALMTDIGQFRDDSKRINPNLASGLIYSAMNGMGRTRGSKQGTAPTLEWRTVLLSTGESTLTSFTQDAGARARVLCIRSLPFGRACEETRMLVDNMNHAAGYYYGTAGPAFVRWLVDNHGRWDEFRDRFHALAQSYLTTVTGPGARLADSAALLGLAGALFHEAIEIPFPYEDPLTTGGLWRAIEAELGVIDADVRALRDLHSWAGMNEARFYGHHTGGENPPMPIGGWLGIWKRDAEWKTLCVRTLALKHFCETQRYSLDGVTEGWRERGWLETDGSGTRSTRQVKICGENARYYVIKREAFDEADAMENQREPGEDNEPMESWDL